MIPTFDDVRDAAARIAPHAHVTPVLTSSSIDQLVGSHVMFKCEHLQRAGAFKFRGATNAVLAIDDDTASRGVAAHSSGNHAAALALAASIRGIACHVVMPTTTPTSKQEATVAYGAEVTLCEPTLAAREATLAAVVAATGATEVHPYDDPNVIAGQGTAALELFEQVGPLDAVIAPVSGGGLLSGTAIAARGTNLDTAVWGAEPERADDAARSLAAGTLTTDGLTTSIADGLLATLSTRTFSVLRNHDVEVTTVTEREIIDAMVLVFARLKQVVEPSAAVALAALVVRSTREELPARIGVILSGGNLDLDRLPFAG